MNGTLYGSTALITGGRRGLGRAMSLELMRAGADVAVVATSADSGDLPEQAKNSGVRFIYLQRDLSRPDQRIGIVNEVVSHLGRLDILINNAGFQRKEPMVSYSLDSFSADLELMVTAVLDLSQQAAGEMIKQGRGKIVHMASISSFQGARNIIGYATAKHALVGLTKCMANELAPHGINVNAIAPGVFETDMARDLLQNPELSAAYRSRIPSGRFGQPADIVGPMMFLVSDASRHVHGHILLVDGGWMGR